MMSSEIYKPLLLWKRHLSRWISDPNSYYIYFNPFSKGRWLYWLEIEGKLNFHGGTNSFELAKLECESHYIEGLIEENKMNILQLKANQHHFRHGESEHKTP